MDVSTDGRRHGEPAARLPHRVYRRRRIMVGLALLAVLALLGGLGVAGAAWRLHGNIATAPLRAEDEEAASAAGAGTELNVLLLGSDGRDLSSGDYGEDDGSMRSDAMVLAHVSADDERIDAVQLPRDTLMDLPACADTGRGAFPGGYGMLNSALNYGPACSVAATERLSGVRVDHFVEMDFDGFAAVVDALGGLPVDLPQPLEDPFADLDLPAGHQVVNGRDALALARTRHAVGDGSDIARMGHQQMVMSAVLDRASERKVLTRPTRLYRFLDAVTGALTVDPGLGSPTELSSLTTRVARIPSQRITFRTMPWQPAPEDPARVLPSEEADTVFGHLAADTPVPSADESGP